MAVYLQEWLNRNSQRSYPLKESVSRTDLTSSYTVPNDFIVDLVLVANVHQERRFYLRHLSVLSSVITGQIYDETNQLASSFAVITSLHETNKFYPLSFHGDYDKCQGKIVIGELQNILAAAQGSFEFNLAATELEPTVVIPAIRGVISLSKKSDNEAESSVKLTGHVKLEEGSNIIITPNPATNSFRIDAVDGAGLGPQCDCPVTNCNDFCFKTINGVAPDSFGNFNIAGVGCIQVNQEGDGIQILNDCESNCSVCSDLESARVAINLLLAEHGLPTIAP